MIESRQGNLPHIEWLDLAGNGVFTECCIVKRDELGNIYHFPVNSLDSIDKKRLARILQSRLAPQLECWDLLSQTVLNNGVNALEYFHQLVKVISPNGQVYSPRHGVIGTGQVAGKMDTRSADERAQELRAAEEARLSAR